MNEQINNQNQFNKYKKRGIFFVLITIFLFILIFFSKNFWLKKEEKQNFTKQTISPTIFIPPTKGNLNFKLENKNFVINSPFNIVINASSEDKQVVGFELVIKFDKKNLKFLSAKSVDNRFISYSSLSDNYLNITLVKNLNIDEPIYFNQTDIITLQFLPLNQINSSIEIVSNYKNRKTFFVNEKNEVFYPKLPESLKIFNK